MRGSIASGTSKRPSSSRSQHSPFRFISMVRLALVTSVMCSPPAGPPVRFQISQGEDPLGLDGVAGVELVDDLAVVPADQKGADERAQRLRQAVGRNHFPGEATEGCQGDRDRWVEVGACHPARDVDAERDAKPPGPAMESWLPMPPATTCATTPQPNRMRIKVRANSASISPVSVFRFSSSVMFASPTSLSARVIPGCWERNVPTSGCSTRDAVRHCRTWEVQDSFRLSQLKRSKAGRDLRIRTQGKGIANS